MKKNTEIPVLTNLRSNQSRLDTKQKRVLSFDIKATELFYLFNEDLSNLHRDYTQNPIYIEGES